MASLNDIIARHNKYQDSLLYKFETSLREIVLRAQGRVIARLQEKLSITKGVIDATPGNMMQLRGAGRLFMNELNDAGYGRLVDAFVAEFKGTLPFLQETIEFLGDQVGEKWNTLGFTAKDFNLLGAAQANAAWAIEDVMEAAAGSAITRGLFGVAGLKFGSLVELLTDRFQISIGKAGAIADTSMSTWYATANARAYDIIAKDLPAQILRYRYSGPVDKLERPFCRHLTDTDKGYTRAEISEMNNGQIPNVWLTRGGWRCRHGWILDTRAVLLELPASA